MSTTDPIRAALERIVSAGTKPIDSTLSKSLQFKARGQAMLDIAAATLAAVPAEPECNDKRAAFLAGEGTLTALEVYDWSRDLGRGSSLPYEVAPTQPLMVSVVRPAEPEVWEWRVVHSPTGKICCHGGERELRGIVARVRHLALERRCPRIAPGPWERVDPESREDEGT